MITEPFSDRVPLVIDTSAWVRHRNPRAVDRWRATNDASCLASCPVATIEILRTARDETAFRALDKHLSSLPQAPVTDAVCRAALTAMRELGARRRLPATDYLIAAAAAERGFGVLHADRHFELLAEVLRFESVRLPE
jgi:predicted nucleic acid-binding protein